MTDLAKLVVKLEAQTAQYVEALDKANSKLNKFAKSQEVTAKGIAKGIAAAALTAGLAFTGMAKAAIDNADHLYKMSQSTGISVEALSQLQHAASLSDLSLEELSKSSAKLARAQADAARGSEASAEAFELIGVKAQNADGTLRSTEDVLLDVADRFSKMSDGAAKAALAQELFGKSGARLIPFLNQGRAGLEAMKKEADALGLTITTKAGAAAEEFNDNLTRLKSASTGIVNQIVQGLLPGFTNLSLKWLETAKAGGGLSDGVLLITGLFKTLVTAGIIVTSVFQQLGRLVYGVGAALVRVAQGEFRLAADEIKDAYGAAKTNVTNDIESIAAVWSNSVVPIEKAAKQMDGALGESIVFNDKKAENKARKASEAALAAIRDSVADLREQVATYGMTDSAALKYSATQGKLADQMRIAGDASRTLVDEKIRLTEVLETLTSETDAATKKTEEYNSRLAEAKSIYDDTRTPAEKYSMQIEKLNALMNEGLITQDTYNRAVERAQEVFDKASKTEDDKFFERFLKNGQDILGDGLYNIINDGFKKGAAGALDSFTDMLTKMATQAIAADIMRYVFGDTGGGGKGGGGLFGQAASFIGGLFGGSRDSGGRGRPNMAYAIGTGAQPELFVPDRPGTFIPANMLRGGGGNVTQNIYAQGQITTRSARQLEIEAARRQRISSARLA